MTKRYRKRMQDVANTVNQYFHGCPVLIAGGGLIDMNAYLVEDETYRKVRIHLWN